MTLYCKVYQFTTSGKPIDRSPCLIKFKQIILVDNDVIYEPDKIIRENFASRTGRLEILNNGLGSILCDGMYINLRIHDPKELSIVSTYDKKVETEFFYAEDDASAILLCEI